MKITFFKNRKYGLGVVNVSDDANVDEVAKDFISKNPEADFFVVSYSRKIPSEWKEVAR